jgi:hypothetical protein
MSPFPQAPTSERSFVFGTRTGRPLGQHNVLRALYRAQERARDADGLPTFPELFEHDARGNLVVGHDGEYVLRAVRRRELQLPDFHALRHGAAMDCDDAEEARDLLRHKNNNVTRAVYRAHFGDRRRELLRVRMEARMEAAGGREARSEPDEPVADLAEERRIQGRAAVVCAARAGFTRERSQVRNQPRPLCALGGCAPSAPASRQGRPRRPVPW